MVRIETHKEMRRMYKENEGEYIRDHPEEYVLFETGGPTGITATFYETKEELRNATAKYKGQFGPTFFSTQIPPESIGSRIHKLMKELHEESELAKE